VERLLRSRVGANLMLLAGAATVPAAGMHFLSREEPAPISPTGHLVIMAVGSAIAAAASAALMWSGARTRDARAVISGGAVAAMTLLMGLHGLATPGVILGPNGVVGLAGGAALPVGAALLSLAAVPELRRPAYLARIVAAIAALLGTIVVLGSALLVWPDSLPAIPEYGTPPAIALMVVGLVLYGIVLPRVVRTYALTRRLADLAVVAGVVWLAAALIPALLFDPNSWGWWFGHALEFAGVVLVGVPVALDVHRGRPSRPLSGDLPVAELVAAEEAFLGPRVRALMARLETKDRSTEEHTRRVAHWAVSIGEALGLAPGRLRDLAVGGLLHDMGKLSVPDAILRKPGPLTDDEMDVIRCHPGWGDELLAELGYPAHVRRVVRGHHERLDGSGYPDGLTGDAIDLETRILAVADVYDALVSPRYYRGAWEPERALALLRDEAGTTFDARCVAALERLVAAAEPRPPELRAAKAPAGLSPRSGRCACRPRSGPGGCRRASSDRA
jgi:HD-GYP domain-containing protein (c-di-GMP phosphodiesterase class II)